MLRRSEHLKGGAIAKEEDAITKGRIFFSRFTEAKEAARHCIEDARNAEKRATSSAKKTCTMKFKLEATLQDRDSTKVGALGAVEAF